MSLRSPDALNSSFANDCRVVTVVGAGRGPLVACALRAAQRANRRIRVYAVDKNVSAFTTYVVQIQLYNRGEYNLTLLAPGYKNAKRRSGTMLSRSCKVT